MWRWILPLVWLFSGPAYASPVGRDSNYNQSITTAAGYTGVFDALGSTFFDYWSLRAGSAAIAAAGTQPLIKVLGAGSGVNCQILVASTGWLGVTSSCSTGGDNGQSALTFCTVTSTSCTVIGFYDQGTAGNNLLSGGSPVLVFNCLGGNPCIQGPSNIFGTLTAQAQPFNTTLVAERTGSFTSFNAWLGNDASVMTGFGNAANESWVNAGISLTQTATDNVWHSIQGTLNGTSLSAINTDGTDLTGKNAGTNPIVSSAGDTAIGNSGNGFFSVAGNFIETGIYLAGTAATPTQRAAICHNQYISDGLPNSC